MEINGHMHIMKVKKVFFELKTHTEHAAFHFSFILMWPLTYFFRGCLNR